MSAWLTSTMAMMMSLRCSRLSVTLKFHSLFTSQQQAGRHA
jgi:hypothetical protein